MFLFLFLMETALSLPACAIVLETSSAIYHLLWDLVSAMSVSGRWQLTLSRPPARATPTRVFYKNIAGSQPFVANAPIPINRWTRLLFGVIMAAITVVFDNFVPLG